MSEDPARKHRMFARGQTSDVGFSPASLLTRTELLDHVRNPRNRCELPDADIVQEESNPLCGDLVTMYAKVSSEQFLLAVHWTGSGCIISQAAASMLTEFVRGKTAEVVLRLERADMERLLGGSVSPSRVKCAMLSLVALRNGLENFLSLRAKRSNLSGRDAEKIASSPASHAGSSQ